MKKLNRKGFTLIELLAIIVILAILVIAIVPKLLSTIADAKVERFWSLAGEVAKNYNNAVAQDLLSPGSALQGATATTNWQCIKGITTNPTGNTLAGVFDLSEKDLQLDGNPPSDADLASSSYAPSQDVCSAIKLNDAGNAVVFLNAKAGGRFAISGKSVYALSTDDNGFAR